MLLITIEIFLVAFLLNLVWEVVHSQLYVTCLRESVKKYIPSVLGASLKDGVWIVVFFLLSTLVFGTVNILTNAPQLIFFTCLAILFSFTDEKLSLRMKRWEYSTKMPTIFGVGISPLLEVAVTGVLTFLYVFFV